MFRLLAAAFLVALTGPGGAAQSVPAGAPLLASADAAPADTLAASGRSPGDAEADRLAELERQVAELEAAAADAVQFSGEVYTRYGVATSGTGGSRAANSFSIERWHFTGRVRMSDAFSFRGTTDVVSTADAGLGYAIVVKFAHADWKVQPWLTLRGGVIQNGWENHANRLWGYRAVAPTLAHSRRYMPIADLGVVALAELPRELGRVALQVNNGNGFRRLETDSFKDVSGRAILTPFASGRGALAGVQTGGYVYAGRYNDGRERTRWGGLLGYATPRAALVLNYEQRRDGAARGAGVGVFGRVRVAETERFGDLSLLGLVDLYDPNGAAADDGDLRGIVGLAYALAEPLTFTVHYQRTSAEAPRFERYDGTVTDVDSGVFVNAIITY